MPSTCLPSPEITIELVPFTADKGFGSPLSTVSVGIFGDLGIGTITRTSGDMVSTGIITIDGKCYLSVRKLRR